MQYAEMKDRVAVVTGGGKGLGLAMATAFAQQGARVAVLDLDSAAAREAREVVEACGASFLHIAADVSEEESVTAAFAAVQAAFGGLDYLVNNAALAQQRVPMTELSVCEFDRIMAVNVRGVWLGMKHAATYMSGRGGCIVNISSLMGLRSQPGVASYSASKHAVLGLTKSGAVELGPLGIRVNAVCPGRHATPMIRSWRSADLDEEAWQAEIRRIAPATQRIGEPEEVAAAVLFLCSGGASNIHGVALPVDGGWSTR